MKYQRMILEAEAPNLLGYEKFDYNLTESSDRVRLDAPRGHEERAGITAVP